MIRWLAVLSVVILSASGAAASAQQPQGSLGSGRLSAQTSGAPLPAGTAIQVLPGRGDDAFGDEPLLQAARAALVSGLRERGFRIDKAAEMRLTLAVSNVGYNSYRAPSQQSAGASPVGPRPHPMVTDQFRVPFEVEATGRPPSLAATLTLYYTGGAVLWTATVSATGRFPDPDRTLATLVRAALTALGTSAERSFEVGCTSKTPDRLCVD